LQKDFRIVIIEYTKRKKMGKREYIPLREKE